MGDQANWRVEAEARLDKVEAAVDLLSRLLTTAEEARSNVKRAGKGIRAVSVLVIVGAIAAAAAMIVGKRPA